MVALKTGQLEYVQSFQQLVPFLRDELDWPIDGDDFIDLEDVTFEYDADELHIKPEERAKIREIRQLRPLVTNQPWGIFFVSFESEKNIPVVVLRRILRALVVRKRHSANATDRKGWDLNDLLFISAFGRTGERELSFAHFSEEPESGGLAVLRVLGWDNKNTRLHLANVYETLRSRLRWPDEPEDAEDWRKNWASAFVLKHREAIDTSKALAIRLAKLATQIRERANTIMTVEPEEGPMRSLHNAFRECLIHDLDEDDFADMFAQTIAYGLLTARISRESGALVADDLAHMVPVTNPFLKELFETFLALSGRSKRKHLDFDELGIDDVVETLRNTKIEAVLRDFGDRNPQEDPVIHFYELFLREYDAQKRLQRGVFYTPRPVVSFIVRSVDEILRTEFELKFGLADTTTWGEMTERIDGLDVPKGTEHDQPFVQILDPATGTGTFLVEAIDLIHKTMTDKWKADGHGERKIEHLWNDYVPKHLLTRLHGYELMMAPYAIAHMKIGLKLYETGYRFGTGERARVYLTNSLEPAHDFSDRLAFAIPALAHEAKSVNEIKKHQRFTVVIGNPPYSVSSWNTGTWITNLAEDYKRTVRSEESQIQSLSNDYIKFLRFGQWLIETSGLGLLGLITGHGFLHGTQPRDLRRQLVEVFDRCYCLDLHGSIRRSASGDAEDEPVFQIMTGVAILVGLRTTPHVEQGASLQTSLIGRLEKKLSFLVVNTAVSATIAVSQHEPTSPYFFFASAKSEPDLAAEYRDFIDLPAIFGTGNRQKDREKYWATGFATQQDDLAISFSPKEVANKMAALAESQSFEELRGRYRLCTTNQWNYQKAKKFAEQEQWIEYLAEVAYRPFDRRWTVYHRHVLTIPRMQVMSQLDGNADHNIGLVSSRAVNDLVFAHCFVTVEPIDKISISTKTSTNAYVFPLYFTESDMFEVRRRPNISGTFLSSLAAALNLPLSSGHGVLDKFTPEVIFCYLYAILHSISYRERYAEFLKIDFPRLPLTDNTELFQALANFGGKLVARHLLDPKESKLLCQPETRFICKGNPRVEPGFPKYSNGKVMINASCWFEDVTPDVWEFHIGGYQVCRKWLKDRAAKGGKNPHPGRVLSNEDILHYRRITVSLKETIRIMKEIDTVIDKHGGWPGAFVISETN